MSGYRLIKQIDELKATADKLGFMLCHTRHYYGSDSGDLVSIKPKDNDSLPIYSRDAEFFIGTIDELISFFRGIEWARNYDQIMKVSDPKKRERKEQDERNRQLVQRLKDEKVEVIQE